MMDCDALLDLMPDRAAGKVAWPAGAEAHLASCDECRRNWELVQAGARVGAQAAAQIDPDRVSRLVLARLAEARKTDRRRKGWTWGTLLAAAAAMFLVIYSGHRPESGGPASPPVASAPAGDTFSVPLSGLDDLDVTELKTVYDQLDGALGGGGSAATPHLEELTPDEMQQVLNSMEG